MNTNGYDDRRDQSPPTPTTPSRAAAPKHPSGLVHGDPSLRQVRPEVPPTPAAGPRSKVIWAHSTDAAALGMKVLGRGIGKGLDFQVAATKTAVRVPVRAAGAVGRRVSASYAARKERAREAVTPATPGTPGTPVTPVGPSASGTARGSRAVSGPGVVWQP